MLKHLTLQQARENMNLTTVQVSNHTGLTVHQIERIEANSKQADAFIVMMLCELYKISPDHVYFGHTPYGEIPLMEGELQCATTG